jgi:hypothetical protein
MHDGLRSLQYSARDARLDDPFRAIRCLDLCIVITSCVTHRSLGRRFSADLRRSRAPVQDFGDQQVPAIAV